MGKKIWTIVTVIMTICALALASCTKENEQDLSGYLTKEELKQAGYMTQEDFDKWVKEHANDSSASQLVTIKNFNVTFPAINDDFSATTTYNGLQSSVNANDVVLVYFNTNLGGWIMLPFSYSGLSYSYANSNGVLTFHKSLNVRNTVTSETFSAKALIIPQTIYTAKQKEGVNHMSYEEVSKAYSLDNIF